MKTRQQQRSIAAVAILLLVVSISYFAYLTFIQRSDKAALELSTDTVDSYAVPSLSIQNVFKGIRFDQPKSQAVTTQPASPTATAPKDIQLENSFNDRLSGRDRSISQSETTQRYNAVPKTEFPSLTLASRNQSITAKTVPVVTSTKSIPTVERPTTTEVSLITEDPLDPTTTEELKVGPVTDIWITPFGEAGVPIGFPVKEPLNVTGVDPIESVTWEIIDSNVSGASISSHGVLSFTPAIAQPISITVQATADGARVTARSGSYYSFDLITLEGD